MLQDYKLGVRMLLKYPGLGQKPPVYLRPGNRMRLGVSGLGEQEQLVVAYSGM